MRVVAAGPVADPDADEDLFLIRGDITNAQPGVEVDHERAEPRDIAVHPVLEPRVGRLGAAPPALLQAQKVDARHLTAHQPGQLEVIRRW
jgi:hypothetical protein